MSIVIRFILPMSSLFFEKTSGKRSQSSSNLCAVSSEMGLLFNFTFLCALTFGDIAMMFIAKIENTVGYTYLF